MIGVVLLVAMSDTAYAVNTYSLTSTAASNNWSTANWTCAPGPCNSSPGIAAGDFVNMNLSGYTMVIDIAIANPVTMSVGGSAIVINVPSGGKLPLSTGSALSNNTSINVATGGQLVTNGTFGVGGGTSVTMTGGQWQNLGTTTFNSNTNFNWSGGTVSGTGSGIILTSTGGPAGAINLTGAGTLDNCQIQNNGTLALTSSGAMTLVNAASIINQGSLTIGSGGTVFADGGGGTNFINNLGSGTITSSANATIAVQLNNGSSVTASVGILSLTGGGTHSGSFNTSAATTIDFAGGTHTSNSNTTSFTGPGVGMSGGTLAINTALTVGTFKQKGGTLTGSANFTVTTFTWSGGTQATTGGATILASGGTATFDGAVGVMNLQRTFTTTASTGTVNYTAASNPLSMSSGSMLQTASGTNFNVTTDIPILASGGLFNNGGNFRKTGGSTGNTIGVFFQNMGLVSNQVLGAALIFANGGDNSGQMTTNTNPTSSIEFSGGTFLMDTTPNINGSGPFVISGTGVVQYNANMTGPGTFRITSTSAKLQATGAFTFTLPAAGIFDFQAGTIQNGTISIPSGSQMLLASGGGCAFDAVTISNSGQITYNSTNLVAFQNAAQLINNNGGTVYMAADGTFKNSTGGGSITNNTGASIFKSGGSATSIIEVTFNNAGGTLDEQVASPGAIELTGPGTHSAGNFNTSGNIRFNTGVNTFTWSGGTFTGTGYFELLSGTVTIAAATTIPSFYQGGGTINGTGPLTLSSMFQWSGGTQGGSSGTTLNGSTTMDGAMGTMFLTGRSMVNNGSLTFTSGNPLQIGAGTTFSNNAGATFDIQVAGGSVSGTGSFLNNGSLTRSAGGGIFAMFAPFNNNSPSGSVNVQSGTLALKSNGTHTGTFTGAVGTTLEFGAGTQSIGTNAFSFPGTVLFFGGNITFNVSYNSGTTSFTGGVANLTAAGTTTAFNMSSGTLNAASSFTTSGNGNISGGTIAGGGTGSFVTGGTSFFTLNGSVGPITFDNIVVTNGGNMGFSSPTNTLALNNGTVLTNNNILDLQADGPITVSGAGSIINNGTLKKSAGTTSAIAAGVSNANPASQFLPMAGTVAFNGGFSQSAGTTSLVGGQFSSPTTMNFTGGTLNGAGSIIGDVQSSATISPGLGGNTGGISISGNYTQTAAGILNIRIGGTNPGAPTNGFDKLGVSGTAAFGGTLNVGTCCTFTPTNGQTFAVLAFGSRTTDFSTKNLNPFGPGTSFTSVYSPTALTIQAVVSSDLAIGITDSPDPVAAGGTVTYTVTVTNNGPASSPASPVSLTLSGGGTITGTAGFTCTTTATTASCTAPALASAGSSTVNVTVTAPATGPITLTGTVSGTNNDPTPGNDTASQVTTVAAQADLSIAKTGPASATAGSTVVYTITVTNNGPSTANTVQVTDPTPANLTFVSNGGACTSPFPCNLGNLLPAATSTITATYTVSPAATGNISNTATVASTTADPTAANNSSTSTLTVNQSADISITKTGPASGTAGANVTYFITVTNNGPSNATGIVVSDPTPARLTFVSNSGACTGAFPCNVGALAAGSSATISSTYTVTAGPNTVITNTATVTATTADPNSANNSASVNTAVGCPSIPNAPLPNDGATGVPTSGTLHWSNASAASYKIYLGTTNGCQILVGTSPTNSFAYSNLQAGVQYSWRVEAVTTGCTTQTSACFTFTTSSNCPSTPPALITPANGAATSSPIGFSWSSVPGAIKYQLFASVGGAATTQIGETTDTNLSATVGDGPVSWYVVAVLSATCPTLQSSPSTFNNCNVPGPPLAGVVATSTANQTYTLQWDAIAGAIKYEVQEAKNSTFTDSLNTSTVTNTSVTFQHTVTAITPFFYRVRAFGGCSQQFGPYSDTVRAVIIPIPPPSKNPNANAPVGSKTLIVQQMLVPGFPGVTVQFAASVDKPWLSVSPQSGLLPPTGTTLNVTADPSNLPNGTLTGTVILTFPASGKTGSDGSTPPVSLPVSISLVTPVTPAKNPTGPLPQSLIIPSVGHLDGINSHWQSDVRVTNTGSSTAKYQLTFTPDDLSKGVKTTTITIDGGGTTALDDIINNWYGIGALGDSANGVLEIRPLSGSGKGPSPEDVSVSTTTVASSRTYNVTNSGTLGQYIPAIAFSSFVGKALTGSPATVLSLQQIAQSDAYRTNVGVVEAGGQPASVLLTVFDTAGKHLLDFPVSLKANEQRQLNGFLATQGITLNDGRIEAKVLSGDGKITAYASVVNNLTNDPYLVSGVPLSQAAAHDFVVAGVADISNGLANWRSDLRVFNAGSIPQPVTLTFYPQNNDGTPASITVPVSPGEVKVLDNILQSSYSLTNVGGAVHVTTPSDANLIVTGRTYNQTDNGTYGQFIPAVTVNDAIGTGGRTLHILQLEDSARYRTNIGVAEVSGKGARVELTVILPDSKVAPKIDIDLGPNEFQQIPLLSSLGLTNTYNARVMVKVIGGDGKVSAYGSVIDRTTQDPTYVSAQ